ncbi:MAG: P-loop NTPase fold protein [Hyphomicrobiales bacterium]
MTEETNKPQDWNGNVDLLDRKSEADFLSKYLLSRIQNKQEDDENPAFVLNVDAAWGAGKTYMIKNWAEDLRAQGHLVAYVNAWENDHEDDALASIILEIDECVENDKLKNATKTKGFNFTKVREVGMRVAVASAKGFVKTQLNRHLGESDIDNILKDGADALVDELGKLAFEGIQQDRKAKADFHLALNKFVDQLGATDGTEETRSLLIFIDELDRCRPTYAIEMLERVKHLFSVPKIGFVVATDTTQLQHSINAIYGNDFDSSSYLSRFFDRSYQLKTPTKEMYVAHSIQIAGIDLKRLKAPMNEDSLVFLQRYFAETRIELRDIQRCVRILSDVVATWHHAIPIQLTLMAPLIVSYQKGRMSDFDKLNSNTPLKDFLGSELVFRLPPSRPYDSQGIPRPKREENLGQILSEFSSVHKRSLQNVFDNITRENQTSFWAAEQASHEFAILHNNSFVSGQKVSSIVEFYGELVAHAGSLKQQIEDGSITN